MEQSLKHPLARTAFLTVVLVASSALILEAGRYWLAERWVSSGELGQIENATALQPANAEYWYRRAVLRKLEFTGPDLEETVRDLERATSLNPHSAIYWMELGRVYELQGLTEPAVAAFERARESSPASTKVAWAYGNYLLRQGKRAEAYSELRRALETNASLTTLAVSRAWHLNPEAQPILDHLLPRTLHHYDQTLRYLLAQRELDPALTVWHRFLNLDERPSIRHSLFLIEKLIQADRVADAHRVWQQARQVAGTGQDTNEDGSLITNGGFEQDTLNGGFGWRATPHPAVVTTFDTTTAHSGRRSFRIDFDGSANLDFTHLHQLVPVEPRTPYAFSAMVRTEEITTDRGICFEIYDAQKPANLLLSTPCRADTGPWERLQLEFATGPSTRLLAVRLRRFRSRKLDNKIKGSAWIDDVSLVPSASGGKRAAP